MNTKKISSKEHEQNRESVSYQNYKILRDSKFFSHVLCIGDYMYYNFFANSQKKIRDNVLFMILSSKKYDGLGDKFINYMMKSVKNQ